MKRPRWLIAFAFVVMLVLSACGGGGDAEGGKTSVAVKSTATSEAVSTPEQAAETSPPEPVSEQPTKPAPTATAIAQPTEAEAAPEPTEESSGEDVLGALLDLSRISANPDELNSSSFQTYRLRATWTVEPKEGEAVAATGMQIEIAHVSDPLAEEIAFSSDEQGVATKMVHIGDQLWIESGDQWIEVSSDDVSSFDELLFSLDSAMAGLGGNAKLVGQENLNGVDTNHYVFDESTPGLIFGTYSQIKGEIWVSKDEGFVIKYYFTAEDANTTYQWDWEVYDINAPFTIEPPADAQGARDDIPLLPDATNRTSFGTMTTYETASDLEAVIEFYQSEMPTQGWTYDESGSLVMDQFATLIFSKDGTTVTITLGLGDPSGTTVLIQAGE